MKYDDTSWHSEGEYPEGLPTENGATHIGMFLAWAISRDLVGELLLEEDIDQLESLKARQITPGEFVLRSCDGKLTNEDLDDSGNLFAQQYYEKDYLADYEGILGADLESLYEVADSGRQ